MTKTYIKPETITVKVEFQQIMQGTSTIPTGDTPTDPEESDARSFGFNFFEEESEEEY